MLTAISRYGARVLPDTEEIVARTKARGEFIQGAQIAEFERAFERRAGSGRAIAASYGRMAFYYILKALDLPAGSEIIVPALTFWVVPALARVAGLTVVFADVDPSTFVMDPAAFERAITPATRVVVPTHLYGLPCDMGRIAAVAARHNIAVVEDCAHALGATVNGCQAGTIGDAGFFSFQTLKPLNCYGGGMALVKDAALAARVRALADAEPWPDQKRIENRLLVGRLQRIFIKPWVFTISAFPILWFSSLVGANPDVYLWEKIRPLDPLPDAYTERFPNVQAAIGLAALEQLDEWTARTRRHARVMDQALGDLPGIAIPKVPRDRTHVYYQYCVYGPQRDELVVRCVRRGVDIETLHVDVCSDLDLFAGARVEPEGAPGAHRAAGAMQVPVY
jgi:perosamine synthetase